MPPKLSYNTVSKYFESNGCKLISKTYKTNKEKLTYICQCGHDRKQYKFNKEKRCKKCIYESNQTRRTNYSIEQKFQEIIKSSQNSSVRRKNRGRIECSEHTITKNDLLKLYEKQNHKCVYTGRKLLLETNSNNKVSLDRIDSEKGYIPDNIQLTTKVANAAKNDMTEQEFIDFIKDTYENLKSRNLILGP